MNWKIENVMYDVLENCDKIIKLLFNVLKWHIFATVDAGALRVKKKQEDYFILVIKFIFSRDCDNF